MQGTDKLNTITNIVFVLTDVLETNLLEMQQQYKKEGFELRHDSKRNFNTVIAAIKRLKSDVDTAGALRQRERTIFLSGRMRKMRQRSFGWSRNGRLKTGSAR